MNRVGNMRGTTFRDCGLWIVLFLFLYVPFIRKLNTDCLNLKGLTYKVKGLKVYFLTLDFPPKQIIYINFACVLANSFRLIMIGVWFSLRGDNDVLECP